MGPLTTGLNCCEEHLPPHYTDKFRGMGPALHSLPDNAIALPGARLSATTASLEVLRRNDGEEEVRPRSPPGSA